MKLMKIGLGCVVLLGALAWFARTEAFISLRWGIKDPAATIQIIETGLVLPIGAAKLSSYDRYYWSKDVDGDVIIHGVYVSLEVTPPNSWMRDEPRKVGRVDLVTSPKGVRWPADSGCRVVKVRWNLNRDCAAYLQCMGTYAGMAPEHFPQTDEQMCKQ